MSLSELVCARDFLWRQRSPGGENGKSWRNVLFPRRRRMTSRQERRAGTGMALPREGEGEWEREMESEEGKCTEGRAFTDPLRSSSITVSSGQLLPVREAIGG